MTDFVDAADSNSQEDYEMAAVVGECWSKGYEDPFDYGSIVVFHRLVIPQPMPGFWQTMRSAIKREFSRRGALMLPKAFPLEWENRFQDPSAPGKDAFERRLKAMTKHYERHLGVSPLVVSPGLGTGCGCLSGSTKDLMKAQKYARRSWPDIPLKCPRTDYAGCPHPVR